MHPLKKTAVIVGTLILGLTALWHTGGNNDVDEIKAAQKEIGMLLDSRMLDIGEIELHAVFAGPKDGEPVILIHGFPEFWYMWRQHIKILADAGYRVAAIDMRGYNRSGKPKGRKAYSYEKYASDITKLMDTQGWPNANIVSHDIGAVVSWELVFDNPDRVKRAVIFSGAHPLAFESSKEESDIAWYRTFFRMPFLPELVSRVGGLSLTAKNLIDSSRPGTFSEQQLNLYKQVWAKDHAYYSMIGSYRNDGLNLEGMPANGQTAMPVMFINGLKDQFVPSSVSIATKEYLGEENVKLFPELSHWLLEEEPILTATEIIAFLQR
jgi:pimeloyl-ACP methyl ester carboxylesterase